MGYGRKSKNGMHEKLSDGDVTSNHFLNLAQCSEPIAALLIRLKYIELLWFLILFR